MAVEKVYQPYDEQVYNSIPKQQPQTKPEIGRASCRERVFRAV